MAFDWYSMTSDTAGVLATIVAAVFIPFLLVGARLLRSYIPNPKLRRGTRLWLWAVLAAVSAVSIWLFTKTEFDLLNVMNHDGLKHSDSAPGLWFNGVLGVVAPLVFLGLFAVAEGIAERRAGALAEAEDDD